MNNPTYAITWSILKKNQKILAFLIVIIPTLFLIKLLVLHWFSDSGPSYFLKFQMLVLTVLMPLNIMVFNFAEITATKLDQGFPKYTFVHPISNLKLALVPIIMGITFSYFFIGAWLVFITGKNISFQQAAFLLFYVAGAMSWLQMIGWRLSSSPFITVAVFIGLAATTALLVVSTWDAETLPPIIPPKIAFVLLVLLPISGIWLAINSVKRSRTHETGTKTRFLSNVQFIGFHLPTKYTTISQALFRYEWRVFGWTLPMVGIFIASVMIFITIRNGADQKLIDVVSVMSFGLIYLPWLIPAEMTKSELSSVKGKFNGMSSFTASLPISNFQYATAKLKLASRSILLFQFIVLVVINLIIFNINFKEVGLLSPWDWLTKNFGLFNAIISIISINLLFPIVAWVVGGNILSWCLKGERFFIARRISIILFGLVLIIPLSFRIYSTPELRELLSQYASLANIVVFALISVIFFRAVVAFKQNNSIADIKHILIVSILIFLFLLVNLIQTGIINSGNLSFSLVVFDGLMLSFLPVLTSPINVTKNRAR